jgi:NitT/TauT family transport system substrate-binding protein
LDRDLRIGYLPITDASSLLVAHEGGFLRERGVPSARPVLFRSWESLAQAFVVGDVDAVHILMPFAVQLRVATSAPIKVIGWGHTNGSALVVAPKVERTSQLAGATLAIPSWWSIHSVLVQQILRSSGLVPVVREPASAARGTVELVVMAPSDMVPALASGSIRGYAVADPFCAMAEVKGVGRVHRFLGDVWRDHACCAVAVRQELIDRHPAAVAGLASAVVDAQRWLEGHRPSVSGTLTGAGYLPQAEPAVATVFGRTAESYTSVLVHPDWHGERIGFSAFPYPSYTARLVSLLQDSLVDSPTGFLRGVDPAAVHASLVDDRYVRAALRDAGLTVPLTREEVVAP